MSSVAPLPSDSDPPAADLTAAAPSTPLELNRPRIQRLSPALVSRIAAGECVERPASVLKEVVENALDAGATQVDITVEEGGRALLRVVDDGCGMTDDDLMLAVEQHATSKLTADEDLFRILTFGFRGEALASIAAVSRLTLISRPPDREVGYALRVSGSEVQPAQPVAAGPGTTVEVRDLFFNVPARRKFLRTNATESAHLNEQFTRIALTQLDVGFSLRNGQRLVHRLAPTPTQRERIASLFGSDLADVLLPIEREGGGVRVSGLVAPPAESRGSGKWEYVFLNGRYIRDKFVSHAIKEAYRSLIDPRRYPVAFVFLEVEPDQFDVNVHPMKTEVRWRDSNFIHSQVLAAFRERFLHSRLDHDLQTPGTEDESRRTQLREALVDYFSRPATAAQPTLPGHQWPNAPQATPTSSSNASSAPAPPTDYPASASEHATDRANSPVTASASADTHMLVETSEALAPDGDVEARSPGVHPIGTDPITGAPPTVPQGAPPTDVPRAIQIHNAYLILETHTGLEIVDQHALHERILYERLNQRVAARPLESQRLLLPTMVNVPAEQLTALEECSDLLERLGFSLMQSGPQTVSIQAAPTLLIDRNVDLARFVVDLLGKLSQRGAKPALDSLVHAVLDMMACKAAVKAGDPLSTDEIRALLAQREAAERSSHCPHGRPTTLRLTLTDLEKQFHRR